MSKSPYRTLKEKLASNLFSDEERGALQVIVKQAQEAAVSQVIEKQASAQPVALDVDPVMFKEAWENLSVEEIRQNVEKLAAALPEDEARQILTQCRADHDSELQKHAEEVAFGDRVGGYLLEGFLKKAQVHFSQEQEAKQDNDLAERAPNIAAAINS